MLLYLMLFSCLPFFLLLGAIAILPLLARTRIFWESNWNQWLISSTLGAAALVGYLFSGGESFSVLHALFEYGAFVAVLAALYAASSSIHITGAFAGFPTTNTLFLLIGALLSSLIGTTGASMLLLRPLLRANADRKHKTHVFVFFIFIVSNCGGLLTPIGDPPLFIGFLRGVPFFWTLEHLWKPWLLINGLLLVIFLALDTRLFIREALISRGRMLKTVSQVAHPLHIRGWKNIGFLLGVPLVMILGATFGAHFFNSYFPEHVAHCLTQGIQIVFFGAIAFAAVKTTPHALRHEISFSWKPVREVAALFLGIFLCLLPVSMLLHRHSADLNVSSPSHYFWITGALSSILDNAPTYAAVGELAAAKSGAHSLGELASKMPNLLAAISIGAVCFGAMTYIGNGPNLMVKSICQNHHVKMPSFFGFMGWSLAILIPVFMVISWWLLG